MMRWPKDDDRTFGRRVLDALLIDTLFTMLGFFLAIVLVSYFPLPWIF